jgi:predicted metal-dependent HD superfamily phosphohydrolase
MTQPEMEIRRAWRYTMGNAHDTTVGSAHDRHVSAHDRHVNAHDGYVDALLLRYSEPHRYYHTGTHIMMVIRHLHEVSATLSRQPSTELVAAALYHDAVYDPRADDNEARSATLAVDQLAEMGWTHGRRATVRELIVATAGHVASGADERAGTSDTAILLDADLAILGAEPHSYSAYVTGVRAEYFFVDEERWWAGRGRILREFLDRPRIFATDHMYTELEHRARANIEAELATFH